MAAKKRVKKTSKKKATKKRSSSKAMTTAKPNLPANWEEMLREKAAAQAERTPTGAGNRLILRKNNTFEFQDENFGTEVPLVILDHVFIRNYWDTVYDENSYSPPACFGISDLNLRDMIPSENSPNRQHPACRGCWANEFESTERGGKACAENRLLAVMHAENIAPDADIILLKVPTTSGKTYDKYAKSLTKAAQLPTFAVVTTVSMDQDADWQTLDFEYASNLPKELAGIAYSRLEEAKEMLMAEPDVSGYEKPKGGGAKKKTSKKTSKRSAKKKTKRRGSRFS